MLECFEQLSGAEEEMHINNIFLKSISAWSGFIDVWVHGLESMLCRKVAH